jgi:ABC-type Zn uptake system ZnuABC Zn-binding protein ZnuA
MRTASVALAVAVLIAACAVGGTPSSSPGRPALSVVTTTTVFADMVKHVGGDRVDVHSLVPKGGEVHTFDPAPSDATAVTSAQLLVLNGLGLDDWVVSFAEQAGVGDIDRLSLAEGLDGVDYITDGASETPNPHLWMNVAYARIYADRIRLKLTALDPAGQNIYDANFGTYDARLADLDAWVWQQMATVPDQDRRVVAFHDAFPYFAAAYGLEQVGVVVESPGQDPSAADIAALVEAIREAGVKAILSEVQFSPELAQTIASDTGATVVSDLYTDSLGDPPDDTYEAAIRHDVELITSALR